MAIKTYVCRDFEYEHEWAAFDKLIQIFHSFSDEEDRDTYIIGQPYIEGKELDCLILRHNTIIIADFKSYSGKIEGEQNGKWRANETKIESSGGNPYQQLKTYKGRMYNWLEKKKGDIFSLQHANVFEVIKAVSCLVLFTSGAIDNQVDISNSDKIWFHVTDFKHIVKIIETLRGGITLSSHEMQKVKECLSIDESMLYNPNQPKKTDWDYFLNTGNFQLAWARINRYSAPSIKDYLSYRAFEKDLDSNVQNLIKHIDESGEFTVSSIGYFQVPKKTFTYRPQVTLSASDSIVYQAIINIIADKYEIQLTEHAGKRSFGKIYAGRKSKFMFKDWKLLYKQFRNRVEKMRKEKGFKWQAEIDISGFYDNIQHSILKKILQGKIDDKLCKLLICFLKDCQAQCTGSRLPFGIPQGAISSHLLANIYLLGLDDKLKADEVEYARYVDDFWIVSENQTHLIKVIVNLQSQLGKLGLSLQSKKTSIQEIEKSDPPDFASFGSYAQSPAFTDSATINKIDPESPSEQDSEITEYGVGSEAIFEESKGVSEYHSTSELLDMFHQNADSWLESEKPSRKNESQIIFAIYRLYLQGHRDDNIRDKVFSLSKKMFWRFDRFALYLQLFHNDPVVEDFLLKELHSSPYDFIKACCWRSLSSAAPDKHTDKAIEVIKNFNREYTVRVGALEYIVKQSSYSEQHIELLLSLLKPQSNSFFGKFLFHHLLAMTKRFRMSTQRSEMIWWGLEHPSEELARIAYLNSTQEDLKSYQEESVKQSNLNEAIKNSVLRTPYRIEAICTKIGLLPEGKDFDFHILFTEEEYSGALALLNHIQGCLADKTYWHGACAEIWTLIRMCVCAATQQKDYNEAVKQFPHRPYIKHAVKLKEYDSNLRSKDINPEELKKYRQMTQNTLMAIINWNQKKKGGITSPVFVC